MATSMSKNFVCFSPKISSIANGTIRWYFAQSADLMLRVPSGRQCSSSSSSVKLNFVAVTEEEYRAKSETPSAEKLPTPTPRWQLTRQSLAKHYSRKGAATGIDPSIIWPTRRELDNILKDETEWCPSLQQMQSEIAEENRAMELKVLKREQTIEANMAKMPQMVAEYRKKMAEKENVAQAQQEKRKRLLEEARDKLGYSIDPRSTRFQKMVEEIEKEERKKKKELKRKGIVV